MCRLDDVEAKLSATDHEFDRIRKEAKNAKDAFAATKKKRYNLFNKAFQHISENIDKVYKELTKGKASLMGGVAYLSLEESDVRSRKNCSGRVDPCELMIPPRRSPTCTASSTTPCLR